MRTWLSIRVELVQGGGRTLWPRPGRVFAAARSHTFLALGDAIDTAFARWDRVHLSLFELADELERGTIERQLAKSDLELGLEFVLGSRRRP